MDKDDEERLMHFIEKQVERGSKNVKSVEYTELKREHEDEKIKLDLQLKTKKPSADQAVFLKPDKIFQLKDKTKKIEKKSSSSTSVKRKSTLDEILEEEENKKEKKNRKDYWLCEGIIVKIIIKSLGEKYFKKKGVVESLKDKYVALVKMLDSGDVLKIDQAHVETVIPSEGRLVKIVNGAYRGEEAILKEIHEEKFCATLEIASGLLKGRKISGVEFEDFSKCI